MNKFNLSIAMLYASLCVKGVCAQEHVRQVVTMEEMFSLADRTANRYGLPSQLLMRPVKQ